MEIVRVENLTFTYPEATSAALTAVNLSLVPGEFVTLCGKSGSGKSTLLRLLKPSVSPVGRLSGVRLFEGKPLETVPVRAEAQKIGFIGQNPSDCVVTDTVWHELAFGLESLGEPTEKIRARVAEIASYFGIADWFHKPTNTLSGGEEQLLCLASVMVMQPTLLLLDEPTAKLDPIAAHRFLQSLSRVCRELGTTVLLSEHRLDEALPLSDRMLVMENGRILADGSPRTVAKALHRQKNELFAALPAPTRVAMLAEDAAHDPPLTVREGRLWLEKQMLDRKAVPEQLLPEAPKTVLQAKNLYFRYQKDASDVLHDFSISLHEGELYALLGANGVGKSTALSVLCGKNKPFHGTLRLSDGKKAAILPQEPTDLFFGKCVREDLLAVCDAKDAESGKRYDELVRFFGLETLLERHPYDLSGGERQKAALAKLLLSGAEVLLLDEPTKGLDAPFKKTLAALFEALKQRGISLLVVSHDLEFCAVAADRCGLFFDGGIVSENMAHRFFADNRTYTTAVHRMSETLVENAVTEEDLLCALGKTSLRQNPDGGSASERTPELPPKTNETADELQPKAALPVSQEKPAAHSLTAAFLWLVLAVPLTVLCGIYLFDDRKYLFISLLIMAETALPFFALFEKRKPKVTELVVLAALCAVGVGGRVALVHVPQFKPVAALVIVSGVCFGGEYGFLVGSLVAFLSNFFFGQGPWTPWQMFAFGLIGLLAGVFFYPPKKVRGSLYRLRLCVFGFLTVLVLYGGLLDTATVLMAEPYPTLAAFLAAFAAGFPLNLIHAFSTVLFLFFFGEPLMEKLERVKTKYGLR